MADYEKAKAEHYRRIRTDPVYRLNEQMEEMRVQALPAFGSYEPYDFTEQPTVHTTIYLSLDKKAMELQNRIVALEAQAHSHIDKKKSKYIIDTPI